MKTAEELIRALGGRWHGYYGSAKCPAHDDRSPSFSARNSSAGKVLVRCHAGCDQEAVLLALKARGLWELNGSGTRLKLPSSDWAGDILRKVPRPQPNNSNQKAALQIWSESDPAPRTRVQTYLESRGITIEIPESIRFLPAHKHKLTGTVWPCMTALVTDRGDKPIAIHRTYLDRDGRRKAPLGTNSKDAKMALGPCRGGAVRLGNATDSVALCEGIEDALSVMQSTGMPAWATLGTSGLVALELPDSITDVTIFGDDNHAGRKAANDAAARFKRLRVGSTTVVRVAWPTPGRDWNQMLRGA